MDSVIVFQEKGRPVSVMRPSIDCGLSVLEIGQKDVPSGVPFWIVSDSLVPIGKDREEWEVNQKTQGEPSGIGRPLIVS